MKNIYLTFILIASTCLFIGCGEDDPVAGCMDNTACNYNADATEDDGSCQVPLDAKLELVSADIEVTGTVGEELISHIEIRNASCMDMMIGGAQTGPGVQPTVAQVKFCIGTQCYNWTDNNPETNVTTSDPADDVALASFEEADVFQGYLRATEAGEYIMTYTITSCCAAELEVDVTFIVE